MIGEPLKSVHIKLECNGNGNTDRAQMGCNVVFNNQVNHDSVWLQQEALEMLRRNAQTSLGVAKPLISFNTWKVCFKL